MMAIFRSFMGWIGCCLLEYGENCNKVLGDGYAFGHFLGGWKEQAEGNMVFMG
jgi:hypothetical protein